MIVLILYFIAATIEIIGEFTENYQVIFYSKILLMPLLMIYAFTQQKQKSKIIFLLLGLFFSWFGDIFLMIRHQQPAEKSKLFFILGLVFFLLAHVQYIIAFIKDTIKQNKAGNVVQKPYQIIPFIVFVLSLWMYLGNSIQAMKLPIYAYSIVIVTMSITALNRYQLVSSKSFTYVFIGALLFMFSDSCIAVSAFKQHFYLDRVCIMFTYIIAQYLITKGYLENINQNN